MATFTFNPSLAPTSMRQPRVLSVKFGDGYEQRNGDGINNDLRKWSLTFQHLPNTEADSIESFFVTNNSAITPFDWTPPRGAAGKFICRSWNRTMSGPLSDTITAVFEEVTGL